MENLNFVSEAGVRGSFRSGMFAMCAGLLVAVACLAGCKKDSGSSGDRDYGYAKIVVKCEKKCSVAYGTPDKMNVFEVEASTATYYQRYQRNYNLDINITPLDASQSIDLGVYSREEKQIFHNSVIRQSNVIWNTKLVIP